MHFGFIWYFLTVSGYRQTVRPLCFVINNCSRNCMISSPKLKSSFLTALSFLVINQHWKSTNYYLLSSDFYLDAYFAGNILTIFLDDNSALWISLFQVTIPQFHVRLLLRDDKTRLIIFYTQIQHKISRLRFIGLTCLNKCVGLGLTDIVLYQYLNITWTRHTK